MKGRIPSTPKRLNASKPLRTSSTFSLATARGLCRGLDRGELSRFPLRAHVAGVGPAAPEHLAARLEDPADLAAHLRAADPAPRRHLAKYQQPALDLPQLIELDVGLDEH